MDAVSLAYAHQGCCSELRHTCCALSHRRVLERHFMGVVSRGSNDVLEDTITGGDLDGLAVHAALQELLTHIRGKAPLPEDDACILKTALPAELGSLIANCHRGWHQAGAGDSWQMARRR